MSGFFAMLSRMKYIARWGLMRSSRPENLSEHTTEVAMLTHALIAIHNERLGGSLDAGKGVLLALYHDCAEIITGDLPTPVKYHDPQIRGAYARIERQAGERLLRMLPDDLGEEYRRCLLPGEEADVYRPFVKAADKLSALIKCTEELSAGNREFEKARETILNAEALRLPAAEIFLEEFMPAYSLALDELETRTTK